MQFKEAGIKVIPGLRISWSAADANGVRLIAVALYGVYISL